MASVEISALSKTQHDELACTYAALLLHDGELEITVSSVPGFLSDLLIIGREIVQGHSG